MQQETNSGGCLKIFAIAVPVIALAGFLFYMMSQANSRAEAVSASVVTPYLEKVRAGEYQEALDDHTTARFRERVSAKALKAAYEGLALRHGRFVSAELYIAQEQHQIGGASVVRANYTLEFERAEDFVTYDILGEGESARIDEAYERVSGRDSLTVAVR